MGYNGAMYQPRLYRLWGGDHDLTSFQVVVKETDLFIRALRDLSVEAGRIIRVYRRHLEDFIRYHNEFFYSLNPLEYPGEECPEIVAEMLIHSTAAGVGPMAAVAGAMAQFVGEELKPFSREMIVENGGDIYLDSHKPRVVGLFAGTDSPFSRKIALEIEPERTPVGICTSSGTVGHSLSMGNADAVVVVSPSAILADAAATSLANVVSGNQGIEAALERAQTIDGIQGVVAVKGDQIGFWGDIKLKEGD